VTQTFRIAATRQFDREESPQKQNDNQLMMIMLMINSIHQHHYVGPNIDVINSCKLYRYYLAGK